MINDPCNWDICGQSNKCGPCTCMCAHTNIYTNCTQYIYTYTAGSMEIGKENWLNHRYYFLSSIFFNTDAVA